MFSLWVPSRVRSATLEARDVTGSSMNCWNTKPNTDGVANGEDHRDISLLVQGFNHGEGSGIACSICRCGFSKEHECNLG